MMMKQYLQVTKPGIIFGNLISVIGGFLLASKGSLDVPLFILTMAGVSLVVASGCVFNNYIDRDIDCIMERTKNRALVKGLIAPAYRSGTPPRSALRALHCSTLRPIRWPPCWRCWASLSMWGLQPLHEASLGLRHPGRQPLRCCAAGHRLLRGERSVRLGGADPAGDLQPVADAALYAIAIFRFKDYQAANIPVLPVVKGIPVAKLHITLYILAFMVPTLMLFLGGYAGYKYLVVATAVSVCGWGWRCLATRRRWMTPSGRASCLCSPSSPSLASA